MSQPLLAADVAERRRAAVLALAQADGMDVVVVSGFSLVAEGTGPGWIEYLFGYRLEHRFAYGVIGRRGSRLVLPEGSTWALGDYPGEDVRTVAYHSMTAPGSVVAAAVREVADGGPTVVGLTGLTTMVPHVDVLALGEGLPGAALREAAPAIEPARTLKDPGEVAAVDRCGALADASYRAARDQVRVGASLNEVTAALYAVAVAGGTSDFIILALHGRDGRGTPHLISPLGSRARVEPDDVLTLSLELQSGEGYWVEVARTLLTGAVDAETEDMTALCAALLEEAPQHLRPGTRAGDVFRWLDRRIEERGWRQGHTPGHGIGVDVLEGPRVAPYDDTPLAAGMVVALHPHVVAPDGRRGAYLGQTFVIEADATRALSTLPLEMELR